MPVIIGFCVLLVLWILFLMKEDYNSKKDRK